MGWRDFLFSFRGRAGRARFWLYCFIAVPVYALLLIALWAYALSIPGAYENGGPVPFPSDPLGIVGGLLFFLLIGAITFAGAAVTVKRLHDRNRSWWWVVVFAIAPDVMVGIAEYLSQSEATNQMVAFAIAFAALALAVWGSIELGFLRGTVGDNRFGPDPLAVQ